MGCAAGGFAGPVQAVHQGDPALAHSGAQAERVMLDVRHRLGTAGHDHAGGARGNLSRGVEHGLQARTAAAVDLQPRYAGAQAGVECGDPPDGRCFAAGVAVAEDDVVDVALTETGPVNERPQGEGRQLGGRQRREGAAHPADRSAHASLMTTAVLAVM